jgi:hypothetical protein
LREAVLTFRRSCDYFYRCKDTDLDNKGGSVCVADPSASFRFYEIVVAVKDSAGNESSDTCTVIVEPPPPPQDGRRRTLVNDISGSSARYDLDSLSDLKWNQVYAPSALPSSAPSVSSRPSASPAPSSMPTSEPPDMCGNFAVHARTAVTFAGTVSTITNGNVGVSSGTAITGSYERLYDGISATAEDTSAFADFAKLNHDEKISLQEDEYMGMAVEIGDRTFGPGTYRAGSAINVASGTTVTLDGLNQTNPVFLFQAGTTLITAADTHIILKDGAKAENIIWALGSAATLGARSVVEGSILAGTAITFGTGSELHGCAIAMTAVTFESSGVVILP